MNAVYNGSEPGHQHRPRPSGSRSQKVVLVGADTWAVEVIPGGGRRRWHSRFTSNLLADNGIHIIENARTDLIAAAAQKDGRATFFLDMTVPKAVGFTGTFVSIEAIR